MSESYDLSSETSPADTGELTTSPDCAAAAKKVREFPQTAGVYLMKDAAGRVIYVGKAKNLRSRAGSYFLKAAEVDRRTADLVREIRDIDYIEADSEVDALLLESRLIKDVQPRFNSLLKESSMFCCSLMASIKMPTNPLYSTCLYAFVFPGLSISSGK